MPLRYTNAPDMPTEQFTPRTEFMLSGVQQAQQRHDSARQQWHNDTLKALEQGYVKQEDRDAYVQQRNDAFNNVITKNQGNLAAGYGDVIKAVEVDKTNPYRNLNKFQLQQAEAEQKMALQLGDKAVILSDVANQNLFDPNTGQWNTDLNRITANVMESPDYWKQAEVLSQDMKAWLLNTSPKLVAEWKSKGIGDEEIGNYMMRTLSPEMISKYVDEFGVDALLDTTGEMMAIDNSKNAQFNPETGLNQFQSVDENGNIVVDREKAKQFMTGVLMDRAYIEAQNAPPKKEGNRFSVNVNMGNDSKAAPDNILLNSNFNTTDYTKEMHQAIKKGKQDLVNSNAELEKNNTAIFTSLNQLGLPANNQQDLYKNYVNADGEVDRQALLKDGVSSGNIDNVVAMINKATDNVIGIKNNNYKLQRYNNITGSAVDEALSAVDKQYYKDDFERFRLFPAQDQQGQKIQLSARLGIDDETKYREFIKENISIEKKDFVEKYKDKLGRFAPVVYTDLIENGEVAKQIDENIDKVGHKYTNQYLTNVNKSSPEYVAIESLDEASKDDPLGYVLNNFRNEFGDDFWNTEIQPIGSVILKNRKSWWTNKTLKEIYEDSPKNIVVDYKLPKANDYTQGLSSHIQIKDKETGQIIMQIPNAVHTEGKVFAKEITARQVANSLVGNYNESYEDDYSKTALSNYGKATNGDNIFLSGAMDTPIGGTSTVKMQYPGKEFNLEVEAYNVDNVGKRFRIMQTNNDGTKQPIKGMSNVPPSDLYNQLGLLSGKYAVIFDTNFTSLLSTPDSKLGKSVEPKDISMYKAKILSTLIQ